jgi:hypothetical protein
MGPVQCNSARRRHRGPAGTISEAGLDGSSPQTLITGQSYPFGVAVGSQ